MPPRSDPTLMSHPEPNVAGPWAEQLAGRLDEQRQHMRSALEAHRQRARDWESTLQSHLTEIEQGLRAATDDSDRRQSDIAARLADLESIRQSLEAAHQAQLAKQQTLLEEITRSLAQLHQREAEVAKQQAEVAARQGEIEAVRRGCDDSERHLLHREEQLKIRDEIVAQREAALKEREVSLDQRETSLRQLEATLRERDDVMRGRQDALRTAEQEHTKKTAEVARQEASLQLGEQRLKNQRVAVAHELRARRKEMLAEAERQRAEAIQAAAGDESALALQLAEAKVEISRLKAGEDKHVHDHLVLEEQFEQAKRELLDMHERLQLAQAEAQSAGGSIHHGEGDSSEEADDMRRRLEMALSDVRDLKLRNAELTDQVAKQKSAGPAIAVGTGGAMDWEARKMQLLAQLESDFDEGDPQQKANKLTVEEAIRRTEELMSAKNEEIAELQRLLSEQSGNIGGVAIGAAAIAEMLDADELVKQERENLRNLQEKLREQLKTAEIDLSVERAKIARERALLEEKLRQFESAQQQAGPVTSEEPGSPRKSSSNKGRWLQRLGLKDEEGK